MFIYVAYKDPPELSSYRRKSNESTENSIEKTLLVNPNCFVRIMLEYIRKVCKLSATAQFDLCEENGVLKGLFSLPTYAYATALFDHKKTYYLIVLRHETEKLVLVFPQLNWENKLYNELQAKVKRYLVTGVDPTSPVQSQPAKGKKKDH